MQLQVECRQELGDPGQLILSLQQQTVSSDTEVSPAFKHSYIPAGKLCSGSRVTAGLAAVMGLK